MIIFHNSHLFPFVLTARFLVGKLFSTLFIFLMLVTVGHTADSPVWNPLLEYMQNGNYSAAYNDTQLLLNKYPDNEVLLRIKGICLIETGYYDAAVIVFRNILDAHPDSTATRYYLAQGLAYRGSLLEAIVMIREIMSMAPDSEYAMRAQQALPELEHLINTAAVISDTQRWNIYTRITAEYNDNVPLRSSESLENGPDDSFQMTYSLYGEYRFFDQKIDTIPFTMGLGYSLDGTDYGRDIFKSYDLFGQKINLFFSHDGNILGKFYNVRFEGLAAKTWLDGENYSKISTFRLNFQYSWNVFFTTTFVSSWANKDYDEPYQDPLYSQDSDEYNFGIQNSWYLLDNRVIIGFNYLYRRNDAVGDLSDYKSNDLSGSATISLPWKFRWAAQVSFQQEDFPEYHPVGRLDNIWTFWTSLEHPLYDDKVTLGLNYTYTTADSNLNFSDYHNNIVGLAVSVSL